MSRSVNKATILGNVGNDPEVRVTNGGTRVVKISVATNEVWKDNSGQKQEKTQWHRCTAFGKVAEIVEAYVKKGDRIYIEGRIEYSTSEADGVTRYFTDVIVQDLVMLGGAGAKAEPDSDMPF